MSANFFKCILKGADFSRAKLIRAIFVDAILSDAIFQGANLTEARLTGAECQHADFNNATLKNANLRSAIFKGAFLGSADLTGAKFEEVEISDAYTLPPEIVFGQSYDGDDSRASETNAKVVIYLPNADFAEQLSEIEALREAVDNFMEAFGFELEPEADPITRHGSWYTELWYRTKRVLSKERVSGLFKSMKNAILGVGIDAANAEILHRRAEATQKLLEQIANFDEAAIRLGGVLVIKVTIDGQTRLIVETLSHELSRELDANPLLLQRPHDLYQMLTDAAAEPKRSKRLSQSDVQLLPDERSDREASSE